MTQHQAIYDVALFEWTRTVRRRDLLAMLLVVGLPGFLAVFAARVEIASALVRGGLPPHVAHEVPHGTLSLWHALALSAVSAVLAARSASSDTGGSRTLLRQTAITPATLLRGRFLGLAAVILVLHSFGSTFLAMLFPIVARPPLELLADYLAIGTYALGLMPDAFAHGVLRLDPSRSASPIGIALARLALGPVLLAFRPLPARGDRWPLLLAPAPADGGHPHLAREHGVARLEDARPTSLALSTAPRSPDRWLRPSGPGRSGAQSAAPVILSRRAHRSPGSVPVRRWGAVRLARSRS